MKKKLLWISACLLVAALLLVGGFTLSKYVLWYELPDAFIGMQKFYFRSNVLTENTDKTALSAITVNGNTTTVSLTNGAASDSFSDMDISYELRYYVQVGAEWVQVPEATVTSTLVSKETMSVAHYTVTPVTYEGVTYNEVIVEAQSSAPYTTTLRARICFSAAEYAVSYDYDLEMGLVQMTIQTNGDAGQYEIRWLYPMIPDNADPNCILTAATAAKDDGVGETVTASLNAYTNYTFSFFVDAAMGDSIDAQLSGLTDAEILEVIRTVVFCTKR